MAEAVALRRFRDRLVAHSDPVTLGEATPAADGTFTLAGDTSALEVGDHTVIATQVRSDGRTIERQVALSILAAGSTPAPTETSATPAPSSSGSGALPATGMGDVGGVALLAGLLLVAGVVALTVQRTRRHRSQ